MLAMAAGLGFPQLASFSSGVAIVGTVAYVVSFALGAGPVPGLLVPEITPARLRGRANHLRPLKGKNAIPCHVGLALWDEQQEHLHSCTQI